jgi:hypothetical protein
VRFRVGPVAIGGADHQPRIDDMKMTTTLSSFAFCAALAVTGGLAWASEHEGLESATTVLDEAAEAEAKAAEAVAEEQAEKQKAMEEQAAEEQAREISGD